VRDAVEWLAAHGVTCSTPHPIDVVMHRQPRLIVEAKIVGNQNALFAVRAAVGQLLEYRHFGKMVPTVKLAKAGGDLPPAHDVSPQLVAPSPRPGRRGNCPHTRCGVLRTATVRP